MGILSALLGLGLLVGAPIGVALAGGTLLFVLYDPILQPGTLFRAFFSFVSNYALMSVPFFILAGFLMESTGLIRRLFDFADALVGWVPGGFAYATLVAAVLFGAISGSSTAMAAAMGLIAYPELLRRGYPSWLAAGLIASSGGIALLIPPSVTLIIFGIITEQSIVSLFMAGVIPGLMLALSNAVVIFGVSFYLKLPAGQFSGTRLVRATLTAWPALLMPVAIVGGLYGGVFTPTEAGAAACAYALVYGMIASGRELARTLLPTVVRAVNLTAIVFFLVGTVGVLQFLLANKGWPQEVAEWVNTLGLSPMGFLVVVLGMLILLSTVLTGVAILVLTVPIYFPVAMAMGIDPIHLGIMTAIAIEMGGVIPPVGLNLFAVSGTTGLPVGQVTKGAMPFLATDAIVLVLVVLIPAVALWLPEQAVTSVFGNR